MAINVHAHIGARHDDSERVDYYRHPDVTHTIIFGDDTNAAAAMEKYPDFITAFGCVSRKSPATPEKIAEFIDRGFRGVKIIAIGRPYDDRELFPMYEAIQEAGLPVLFHCGHVQVRGEPVYESSLFMRPGRLDTLARSFPELAMIGAHLGAPWCDEACSVMWKHRNIYFDMSGGTVRLKTLAQLKAHFTKAPGEGFLRSGDEVVHTEMVEKLVFGTNGRRPGEYLAFYRNFCDMLGVDDETRHKIMTGNAAAILGMSRKAAPDDSSS